MSTDDNVTYFPTTASQLLAAHEKLFGKPHHAIQPSTDETIDRIVREGALIPTPFMCEVDHVLPVRVFVEALASAGLTIYRAPYKDSVPMITTEARARELGWRVQQQEDARAKSLEHDA